MIIVHVHHTYWPVIGGCETAIERISENLARLGHEVHVITSFHDAKNSTKHEEIDGIHVHRVKALTLVYPDLTIPREIPVDILRRADVIHGWSQNSLFTYIVSKRAKEFGKKIVTYFLGVDYLRYHFNPLIKIFGYKYQVWITRRVIEITDLALVTNEYDREILRKRYDLESVVLPHGVDEIYLKKPNIAEHFRERYGVEGRIVSYIARIHPTKGLDLLIRAFAEVVKHVSNAVLVIAGRGDEGYLKKCLKVADKLKIKDRVRYLGYISEEDKMALIDASEVVVLPTRHAGESYPLLLDEVASRGKPMVVTNVSKALASRAASLGYIVVNPSPKDLAQGIMRAFEIKGKPKVKSLVKTWDMIATELLKLYAKIPSGMKGS